MGPVASARCADRLHVHIKEMLLQTKSDGGLSLDAGYIFNFFEKKLFIYLLFYYFYFSGPDGDYFTPVGGRPVDPAKRRVAAALRRAFTNMQVNRMQFCFVVLFI